MASTYVNNLRLNEMATGDASGTWGTTTNTNLELIGEALGYGTEAITTNADTHTSTVADGASDAARAMYVKYTGTLDSACTITIAPNTMKRVQIIENATSGSQNIIISQGSGANVTIPTGRVAVVYLDGAGSGAAVVNAFTDLDLAGTLSIAGAVAAATDMTVGDDLTLSSDAAVLGFGADTDVTLTHVADTALLLNSSRQLQFGDSGTYIHQSADGVLDLVADTEIEINATTIDINGAADISGNTAVGGTLVSTGKITADAGIDIDNINIDGTTIALSSGDLTLDSAGDVVLDADGGNILFKDGSVGTFLDIQQDSSNAEIISRISDKDLVFKVNDGGSNTTALTLDGSDAGKALFNAGGTFASGVTITTADNLDTLTLVSTDTDAAIGPNINLYRNAGNGADADNLATVAFAGNDDAGNATDFYRITAQIEDASNGSEDVFVYHRTIVGGTERLRLSLESDETVINEEGIDLDFRVESDGQTHALFVDGGLDNVGIGYSSKPTATLQGLNILTGGGNGGIQLNREVGGNPSSGETLGSYAWKGVDGANSNAAAEASIVAIAAENHSGSTAATSMAFNTKPTSTGPGSAPSERMRITSAGNVGINATNPQTKFVVCHTDGASGIEFSMGSSLNYIQSYDRSASDYVALKFDGEDIRFGTNDGSERMRILSDGKVGIGTSSPTYELDVAGDIGVNEYIYHNDDTNTYMRFTADALTIRAGGDDRFLITTSSVTINGVDGQVSKTSAGGNGGAFLIRNPSSSSGSYCRLYISPTANDATDRGTIIQAENTDGNNNMAMVFKVSAGDSPAEVMRIVASKDLVVGGSSIGAAGALTIQPDEDDNCPVMTFNRASTTNTSDPIRFKNGGSTVSQISYNNSTVTYGTSSDARLKNVLGEAKGLEIVNKLNPVNFEWKDGGEIQDGLIAQEVEELIPYSVNVNEEGYYSMDYSKVVTPLIKAIQEQQEQIDALKSEINLLKGE